MRLEYPVRLLRANLTDKDVAPADFAAVRLEFNRSFGRHGPRVGFVLRIILVVIVFEHRMIDDVFFVEPHAYAGTDHEDTK